MTQYSRVEVPQRFQVTYCLHLQGGKVSQASNQQREGPKRRNYSSTLKEGTSTGLHDVTPQQTVHFTVTAVRTSGLVHSR
jgi:hypothetical protein